MLKVQTTLLFRFVRSVSLAALHTHVNRSITELARGVVCSTELESSTGDSCVSPLGFTIKCWVSRDDRLLPFVSRWRWVVDCRLLTTIWFYRGNIRGVFENINITSPNPSIILMDLVGMWRCSLKCDAMLPLLRRQVVTCESNAQLMKFGMPVMLLLHLALLAWDIPWEARFCNWQPTYFPMQK